MGSTTDTDKILLALGEVKGELAGIRNQIHTTNDATNRRIDDLTEYVKAQSVSLNRRIDDHQDNVDKKFHSFQQQINGVVGEQNKNKRNAIVAGGSASALLTTLAEVIKASLG